MSKKAKYTSETVATRHGNTFIVANSKGSGICETTSITMARKIARALNAMDGKPKAKAFEFDWSGVPERFKFATMDKCGIWVAHDEPPELGSTIWECGRIRMDSQDAYVHIDRPPYPGDWRDSLQQRPSK